MKLEIYQEQEKVVYLKLQDDRDGDIGLEVVDSDGDRVCRLFTVEKDKIRLCTAVDDDLGFQLDSERRVKIHE